RCGVQRVLKSVGVQLVSDLAAQMRNGGSEDELTRLRSGLADVDRQLANFASAVAAGGHLSTLVAAIQEREKYRAQHNTALQEWQRQAVDISSFERAVPATVAGWRAALREPVDVEHASQILRRISK